MRKVVWGRVIPLGIVAVAFLVGPRPTQAQDDRSNVAVDSEPQIQLITLFPVRSEDAIRESLERARTAEERADRQKQEARRQEDRTKGLIEITKEEIDTFKARIKMAKDEEREGDRLDLERRRSEKELALKLYERRRDLYRAEASLADAIRDNARAERDLFEHEIRLADRHSELEEGPGEMMGGDADLRDLEDRAIRLERDRASRAETLARRQRDVANHRMRVFEAQTAVLSIGNRT